MRKKRYGAGSRCSEIGKNRKNREKIGFKNRKKIGPKNANRKKHRKKIGKQIYWEVLCSPVSSLFLCPIFFQLLIPIFLLK